MLLVTATIYWVFLLGAFVLGFVYSRKKFGTGNFYIALSCIYIAAGLIFYIFFGQYTLFSDAGWYQERALVVLDYWNGIQSAPYTDGLWQSLLAKAAWPTFMAAIYVLVGVNPFAVLIFNILILCFIALVLASSIQKISGQFRPGILFSALLVLAPFTLVFGVSIGREAIFWFGICLMTNFFIDLMKVFSTKNLLGILLAAALTIVLRPNLGLPIVLIFILVLITTWALKTRVNKFSWYVTVLLSYGLFFAVSYVSMGLLSLETANISAIRNELSASPSSVMESNQNTDSVQEIETSQESTSGVTSRFDPGQIESTGNTIIDYGNAMILTYPRALAGPFIWELGTEPIWLLSAINLSYWIFILGTALVAIVRRFQVQIGIGLVVASLLVLGLISAYLTNYGILIRFRSVAVLVLFPYSFAYLDSLINIFRSKQSKLTAL